MKLSSVLLPLILSSAAAASIQNKRVRILEDSNAEEAEVSGSYYVVEYADEAEAEEEGEAEAGDYSTSAPEEDEEEEAEAEEEAEVDYSTSAPEEDEEEEEEAEVDYSTSAPEEDEEEEEEEAEVDYSTSAPEEDEEEEEEDTSYMYSTSGAWGSDDAYDLSEYFFDMSQFSLKVHSCASITGINPDEMGREDSHDSGSGDGEWANKTTAVINYRLCPTSTCQDDSWQGCRNVYGNYMVSVKQYLEGKREGEGKDDQNEELCQKCSWCEWAYSNFAYECDIYDECQSVSCAEEGEEEGEEGEEKEEEIELQEFAECTAVDIYVEEAAENSTYYGNRRKLDEEEDADQVYLQIYCDGGTTLKLGIFSDEDCTDYIGDSYDISETTGLNLTEDVLANELTSDCESCSASDSKYYIPEYKGRGEGQGGSGDSGDEEEVSETCQRMYEESLKCNEYIPFNTTAYYEEADEWAETSNNVTCAFLELMQRKSEGTVVSSNSYSMSSSRMFTNSQQSLSGGSFYAAGAALVIVGAAVVVVQKKKSKSFGNQDLNSAFVYTGETA